LYHRPRYSIVDHDFISFNDNVIITHRPLSVPQLPSIVQPVNQQQPVIEPTYEQQLQYQQQQIEEHEKQNYKNKVSNIMNMFN
jgi:hypothetical protein